nr:L-dopachrome tautomerase-related protein [uncultured Amphritea sp.]
MIFTMTSILSCLLISCGSLPSINKPTDTVSNHASVVTNEKNKAAIGTLEVVAEMDINPGNVAVSQEGRIFSSIHPLRPHKFQLVEITSKTTYIPFPNEQAQSTKETKSDDKLDTPLGIIFDRHNRLWAIDLGFNIGQTRLFAYDIDTKKELMRFDIPLELTPSGSFVQDLAVDEKNGFVYLGDATNPGIIVVDINNNTFRKLIDLPSMKFENIDIIINDKVQKWMGKSARVSLDPITLSADRETLYYGAMNGTKWYQLPTKPIRNGEESSEIIKQITVLGEKPISDGAATDENGNHYFTNIQHYGIDVLSKEGKLSTLKHDLLLDWPDSIRIHGDWLYIATNQLYKSPSFTGGKELSTAPFRIMKLKFK